MKNFFTRLIEAIKRLPVYVVGNRPEFDFPVDVPTTSEGPDLWVEKGRYRIMIHYGELAFYKANGWRTL